MDSIVLLAKQPGLTSFASLRNVKKAMNTTKVGHTGTLDSFAQGLLVVCTGKLTRLAGNIIDFDKSYKAVIRFGKETDSLEYTGNVIRESELPDEDKLRDAVMHFTGEFMQKPPVFSALHVNGLRASDLVRSGEIPDLPERKINVYKAELIDIKKNQDNKIEACLIDFTVSKGTYIRSLARDIGNYCGSSAHLIGLYRTRIGNFCIENAAGYKFLKDFTIDSCYEEIKNFDPSKRIEFNEEQDLELQKEILETKQKMNKEISSLCGFNNINIVDDESKDRFCNGKPIKNKMFIENLYDIPNSTITAVFFNNDFYGLLEKDEIGKIRYKFVNN